MKSLKKSTAQTTVLFFGRQLDGPSERHGQYTHRDAVCYQNMHPVLCLAYLCEARRILFVSAFLMSILDLEWI